MLGKDFPPSTVFSSGDFHIILWVFARSFPRLCYMLQASVGVNVIEH